MDACACMVARDVVCPSVCLIDEPRGLRASHPYFFVGGEESTCGDNMRRTDEDPRGGSSI